MAARTRETNFSGDASTRYENESEREREREKEEIKGVTRKEKEGHTVGREGKERGEDIVIRVAPGPGGSA